MKMSTIIANTKAAKAAEKARKSKIGFKTVLKILKNDIQGAEMLPGAILKLTVAEVVGDEFDAALKRDLETDALKVCGITLWRSTTSGGVINIEGINPSTVDEQWDDLINEVKVRAEML